MIQQVIAFMLELHLCDDIRDITEETPPIWLGLVFPEFVIFIANKMSNLIA